MKKISKKRWSEYTKLLNEILEEEQKRWIEHQKEFQKWWKQSAWFKAFNEKEKTNPNEK